MALPEPNAEHHSKLVEVFINSRETLVPALTTGAEIKRLAGQPTEFNLFRIQGDREFAVENDENVRVHKGEHFILCPGLEPA